MGKLGGSIGGLGRQWVVMLDCRLILASVQAIRVVLGGVGRRWVIMLYCRLILASV